MAPLILPHVEGEHRRIIYTITEYEPLLDSSNMTFQDWMKIAQDIKVKTHNIIKLESNFFINSNLMNSSMALWFYMELTPCRTQRQHFLLCSKTLEKPSS